MVYPPKDEQRDGSPTEKTGRRVRKEIKREGAGVSENHKSSHRGKGCTKETVDKDCTSETPRKRNGIDQKIQSTRVLRRKK